MSAVFRAADFWLRLFDAASLRACDLKDSGLHFTMFKELVTLAIIVGFVLNILYVEHPDTSSYTIAFVVCMAVFSPFALAWRHRVSLRKFFSARKADGETEVQPPVGVSEVRLSKGVKPSADVELGLIQTESAVSAPLEGH